MDFAMLVSRSLDSVFDEMTILNVFFDVAGLKSQEEHPFCRCPAYASVING